MSGRSRVRISAVNHRIVGRLTLMAVMTAAVLMGPGCGVTTAPSPTPQATLSGTVHVLGGSTLVPNVTVTAQGRSTTSNAGGAFSITGLSLGNTPVDLSAAGYRPLRIVVDLVAGANSFSIAIEPE